MTGDGTKYRTLQKGETVQAGDEKDAAANPWHDEAKWVPIHPSEIGEIAPDPAYPAHRRFRRKIVEGES